MKKTANKKVRLHRETLRTLSPAEIRQVAGALAPRTTTYSAIAASCSVGGYTCTCECV